MKHRRLILTIIIVTLGIAGGMISLSKLRSCSQIPSFQPTGYVIEDDEYHKLITSFDFAIGYHETSEAENTSIIYLILGIKDNRWEKIIFEPSLPDSNNTHRIRRHSFEDGKRVIDSLTSLQLFVVPDADELLNKCKEVSTSSYPFVMHGKHVKLDLVQHNKIRHLEFTDPGQQSKFCPEIKEWRNLEKIHQLLYSLLKGSK